MKEEDLINASKEISAILRKYLGEDINYILSWSTPEFNGEFTNVEAIAKQLAKKHQAMLSTIDDTDEKPTHH